MFEPNAAQLIIIGFLWTGIPIAVQIFKWLYVQVVVRIAAMFGKQLKPLDNVLMLRALVLAASLFVLSLNGIPVLPEYTAGPFAYNLDWFAGAIGWVYVVAAWLGGQVFTLHSLYQYLLKPLLEKFKDAPVIGALAPKTLADTAKDVGGK